MKKLLQYELKYNLGLLLPLFLLLIVYTAFSVFDYQLLSGPAFEIDYWGGLYSFFMSIIYIIFWIKSSQDNRVRLQVTLPVKLKTLAWFRLYFNLIPMLTIFLYLVVVHLIIFNHWHAETASLIGQTGLLFGIFSAIYIARDIWLLLVNKNNFVRVSMTIIPVICFIILTAGLFVTLHILNKTATLMFFYFSKTFFYLNAVVIISVLPYTFLNRKSYLQ